MPLLRDVFIALSQNDALNEASKKVGLKFGASKVVAGITVEDTIERIKDINAQGMSVSFDNLGEFVTERSDALKEKDLILEMIQAIGDNGVDASASIKLTQIGLHIDYDFCLLNIREIVEAAKAQDMFVNIDMENHDSYDDTIRIVDTLIEEFDNVGTVLQSYLFTAKDDVYKYKDNRIRFVKGAYKESPQVALQEKADIDKALELLIRLHLTNGSGFTSIATHDHNIIENIIEFIKENDIPNDQFEFQMLFGFRKDLQRELVDRGYNVCVYIPFGSDWYAYFMRRLAERPQNINLVVKSITKDPMFKTGAAAAGMIVAGLALAKVFKK
ncbi:proline dehydrogenase family protein [Salinicoccus sp. ID82-1]|uniref:proline dehydrogenase family protein n=1 Tax=Salinicoccus sp. ID82-1 TaxID=2820269 RepID=UPI001F2EEE6B|nr:proline dehydrogenase family protein [Salinicoccus sp. ID82-1]MCG1009399.1 proline dehydrogenase family protein [Salinicoccus sp. ID82-1]